MTRTLDSEWEGLMQHAMIDADEATAVAVDELVLASEKEPEAKLMTAVLVQAVLDLLAPQRLSEGDYESARSLFFAADRRPDFECLCECAGEEPERWRTRAWQAMERAREVASA